MVFAQCFYLRGIEFRIRNLERPTTGWTEIQQRLLAYRCSRFDYKALWQNLWVKMAHPASPTGTAMEACCATMAHQRGQTMSFSLWPVTCKGIPVGRQVGTTCLGVFQCILGCKTGHSYHVGTVHQPTDSAMEAYKHIGGKSFKPIKIAEDGGLIFAGYFKPSKIAQIVISPGDGVGHLRWYECTGDPEDPKVWVGHDLIDRPVIHGHTLQLGDIDRDGHLDIFAAEMAKWSEKQPQRDNPSATAWVFYGDGQGHFRKTELITGHGWHEGQLGDLDGDGDLDLLNKPYNWDTPRVDVWLNNGTRAG